MKTRNVFLVASPFQLLNAIEASMHFSEADSMLIVLQSADSNNNQQMTKMLDLAPWDRVAIVKSKISIVTYAKAMSLLYELRSSGAKFDKVFIGEYKSHTFHTFCQNIDAQYFFNLDDGVSTIELQRHAFNSPVHGLAPDTGLKRVLKYLVKMRFALNGNKDKDLAFGLYTCFDLVAHPGQTIIANTYQYLSTILMRLDTLDSTVYFYGSSISEKGIMTIESEISMLKHVRKHFKALEREFVYIPHRHDSLSKLTEIRQLGVKVKFLRSVAEVDPLFSAEIPSEISSFFSTALYTLGKIYNYDEITAFRIPPKLLLDRRAAIGKLYDAYERHMTIIDL